MMNFDLTKYSIHAVIAALGISLYDVVVDNKSLSDSFVRNDAMTIALSAVVVNVAHDVLTGLVPFLNENNFAGMLARPLLTGAVYMMLYDKMMNERYQFNRNSNSTFYIGFVGCVISSYAQSPVAALLGIRMY